VSLISVWHLLNGVGWIFVGVWLLFVSQSDPRIVEGAARAGVEIPVYVAGFLFLAVLSLGSGVGLWKRCTVGMVFGIILLPIFNCSAR
jgi:hypothetical protein